MNTQNILKYYGSKLDVKLDYSEFYDLELVGVDDDYDANLLDFTTGGTISYSSLVVNSDCLDNITLPITYYIDSGYTINDCDIDIRRRTERGWTIDLVVDKNNYSWVDGNILFYLGTNYADEDGHYLDNNLSFSVTDDGKIQWAAYRYSGYCDTVSGYTETKYISSGQTQQLFEEPYNSDNTLIFNLSITFQRYNEYNGCDLSNEGGWNDLITGVTVNNTVDTITGATENVSYIEVLNEKWWNERNKRLGRLSIYINGKRIYKLENWEEVIPSKRDDAYNIIQRWGGSVIGLGIHPIINTSFLFQKIRFYEEPLNPIQVKHNYLTTIKPYYNITNTDVVCADDLIGFTDIGLLTENSINLITEDNNILIY